jgi:hypothetical protein
MSRNKTTALVGAAFITGLLTVSRLFAIGDYDLYPLGAKGIGLGGAFTAVADDLSAFYWNPAGLVRQDKVGVTYLFDSQFLLGDIRETLSRDFKITYQVPPLIAALFPLRDRLGSVLGISVSAPVQMKFGYGDSGFYMVQSGPSFAFVPLPKLSVGATFGILTSNKDWGFGLAGQAGVIWAADEKYRFGIVFRSPISFSWEGQGVFIPLVCQAGMSVKLAKKTFISVDLEYQDWPSARWIRPGADERVVNPTGLFRSIIPHIGLATTESKYGAHLRFGFTARSELDVGRLSSMYFLSFGVGARALKNLRFEGALVDGFIFSLLNPGQRPLETLQLSCEYSFD